MERNQIYNVNIVSEALLPTAREIKAELPLSPKAEETVYANRKAIENILDKKDHRLLVVIGPCSIHDYDAAIDYAKKLKQLSDEVDDTLLIVLRTYFEKPRTIVGWKGFINDPDLNDSFKIDKGLKTARQLLIELAELGISAGTEALDPITPQYIHDLISWTAIGARTTESQKHRELSSGLSTPVGFKNGTDGNIEVAINALRSVSHPHHFLGINLDGQSSVMQTRGNKYAHIVLRGGNKSPNYDSVQISLTEGALENANLPKNIMVDCSHANSLKDPKNQPLVLENCVNQIKAGNRSIIGAMIESNINEGKQSVPENLSELKYGVSITDACISWETTKEIILKTRDELKEVLPKRLV